MKSLFLSWAATVAAVSRTTITGEDYTQTIEKLPQFTGQGKYVTIMDPLALNGWHPSDQFGASLIGSSANTVTIILQRTVTDIGFTYPAPIETITYAPNTFIDNMSASGTSVRFWCTISGTSDSGGAVCENWYSNEGVATTETEGESAMRGLEYQTYELHKSGPATAVVVKSTKTIDHEDHAETTSPSSRISGAATSEATFTSIKSTTSGGRSTSQTATSANATATGSASHVRGYSLVWICGAAALAAFFGQAI